MTTTRNYPRNTSRRSPWNMTLTALRNEIDNLLLLRRLANAGQTTFNHHDEDRLADLRDERDSRFEG